MGLKVDQEDKWKEEVYLAYIQQEKRLFEEYEKREIPLKFYKISRKNLNEMKKILLND